MSIQGIKLPKPIQKQPEVGFQGQQSLYSGPDGNVTTKDKALSIFQSKVKAQNDGVIAHEMAHNAGAGPQASGSPHYDTVSFMGTTVITGGHQNVSVPAEVGFKAAKPQIEKTIKAAEYALAGAEAPAGLGGHAGQLSAADISVAAKARAILSSANVAFGKRQDIDSKLAKTDEKNDGELTSTQIDKARQGGDSKKVAPVGSRLNFMG